MSQSLWSRDYFLIHTDKQGNVQQTSQSLWSRDYFLIYYPLHKKSDTLRRNPFGAGTIF